MPFRFARIVILHVGAALFIAGVFISPARAQLANSPWPKWQRDLRNSGWTPAVGPSEPRVKWRMEWAGGSLQPGPAVGPEGELYVGRWMCRQPMIVRRRPNGDFWPCAFASRISREGQVEWNRALEDWNACMATLAVDGSVFLVDGWFEDWDSVSHLYALSTAGHRQWGPRVNPPYARYEISHMTLGRDGTIYYPDGATALCALRPQDGSELWRRSLGNRAIYSDCPSIGEDGTVYTSAEDEIWALDPQSGAIRWSVPGPTPTGVTGTSIGLDGTIYGCFNPRDASVLMAISPDGRILWQTTLASRPTFPPSIDSRGRVILKTYSSSLGSFLECYDPTGSLVWQIPTPGTGTDPVVIDGHDNIYFISGGITLRLLAYTSEGEYRWEWNSPTSAIPRYQAPVMGPDGTIYMMVDEDAEDGVMHLYAFGPGEAPDPAWVGRLKP